MNQEKIDLSRLPRHIAIIMDGNGRWAKSRGLPRSAGHAAGAEVFRKIASWCRDIGMEYLTVYAFSTENWKRPVAEVGAIMSLLEKYLLEAIDQMERDKVKMCFLGDVSPLPPRLRELISETNEISRRFDGCQVNICLNYGGRDEIIRAIKNLINDMGSSTPYELTPELFENYLYSSGMPDPDLIIRPSGEYRLSNFLLWQSAYSEFYFTDKLWPDFTEVDMIFSMSEYQKRSRRFGDI
jgi:undecaprenyl diphosphate synthase